MSGSQRQSMRKIARGHGLIGKNIRVNRERLKNNKKEKKLIIN